MGGFWQCPICTFAENPDSFLACGVCAEARPPVQPQQESAPIDSNGGPAPAAPASNPDFWICEVCTFSENPKEILCCSLCGSPQAATDEAELVDEGGGAGDPGGGASVTEEDESEARVDSLIEKTVAAVSDDKLVQITRIQNFGDLVRQAAKAQSRYTYVTANWILYALSKDSNTLRTQIVGQGGVESALHTFKHTDERRDYLIKTLAALIVACLTPNIPGKIMYSIQADVKECSDYLLSVCTAPINVNGKDITVQELKSIGEKSARGRLQAKSKQGGSSSANRGPQIDPAELAARIDTMAQTKDIAGIFQWLSSKSGCRPMVNLLEREILYKVLETLVTFAETDKNLRGEMIQLGEEATLRPLIITAENADDWSEFPQRDQALVILLIAYLLCARECILDSLNDRAKQDYNTKILLWLEQLDEYSESLKALPKGFPPQLRYLSGAARIYLDAHTSSSNANANTQDENYKTLGLIQRHMERRDTREMVNLLYHHSKLRIQHPSLQMEILVYLLKLFDTDHRARDDMIEQGMPNIILQIFYSAPLNSVEIRTVTAMIIGYLLRSDQLLVTSDDIQATAIRDCVDYLTAAKRSVVINHASELGFNGMEESIRASSARIHLALSISKIVYAGEEARDIVARGPIRKAYAVAPSAGNGIVDSHAHAVGGGQDYGGGPSDPYDGGAAHASMAAHPQDSHAAAAGGGENWACYACTYAKNAPNLQQCEFCGTARPVEKKFASGPTKHGPEDTLDIAQLARQMSAAEVGELVLNKDVFGLLCVVNRTTEPNHKMVKEGDPLIRNPLDTALALMVFARDDGDLRESLLSQGALSVLTKIFRESHKSPVSSQLRTLAALTAAYLVPAANQRVKTDLKSEILECTKFLKFCNLGIKVNGMDITREELQLAGESSGKQRLAPEAKLTAVNATQTVQRAAQSRNMDDIGGVLEDLSSLYLDRETQLTLLAALMNRAEGQPQARDQMITLDAFEVLQSLYLQADKSDLELRTVVALAVAYLLRSCYPRKIPLNPTKRRALLECLDFLKSGKTTALVAGIEVQRDERNLLYLSNQARNYFTLLDSQELREKRSQTSQTQMTSDVAVPSLKRGRSVLGGALDIESSVFYLGSNELDRKLDAVLALLQIAKESPAKRALMHNYGVVTRLVDVIRIGHKKHTPLNTLAALTVAYILPSLDSSILSSSKNDILDCLKILELQGPGGISIREVELSAQEVKWASEILQEAAGMNGSSAVARLPSGGDDDDFDERRGSLSREEVNRGQDIAMLLKLQNMEEEDNRNGQRNNEPAPRLSVDLDFEHIYRAKDTTELLDLLRTGSCRMLDASLLMLTLIKHDKAVGRTVVSHGGVDVLLRIFSHWAGTSGELRMAVAMIVALLAPLVRNPSAERTNRMSECTQFVENNNAKAQLITIRAANKVNSSSKFKLEPTSYNCTRQDGFVGIITLNSLGIMVESKSWLWNDVKNCEIEPDTPTVVRLSMKSRSEPNVDFDLNDKDARRLEEDILGRLKAFKPSSTVPMPMMASMPSGHSFAGHSIEAMPSEEKDSDTEELTVPKVLDISYADRPEFLGVSVYHLENVFLPEVQSTQRLSGSSKFYEIENLNNETGFVRNKGLNKVCPLDGRLGAAYVHCLDGDDHVGLANHMLSWTWSYSVRDVVGTMVGFCEANNYDPKRTYVWICCLCLNQHRVVESNKSGIASKSSTVDFENEFQRRVVGIGRVLVMMRPWGDPANLKRVWCIFETFMALTSNCELSIVMPPRERDRMAAQLFSSFGRQVDMGIDSLYKALNNVDLEKAQASVEQDRIRIHDLIRERIGFQAVNLLVRDRLRQWVRHVIDQLVQERAEHEKRSEDEEKNEDHDMMNAAKLSYCTFLKKVGDIYDLYGDFPAAHEMYKKCCDLRQDVLGFDNLDVAEAYTDLGRTLFVQGANDLSMDMYLNALRIQEKLLAKNDLDTARTYFHVGRLLQEMGDFDESMTMMQKCLAIQEEVLGKHRETAVSYTYVGLLLAESNLEDGFPQGLDAVQKARVILEESVGPSHPDSAFCYGALATLLQKCDRLEEALGLIEKCRSIQESVLGDRHPSLAKTYVTTGEIMTRKSRPEEAIKMFRRALDIFESSTGGNHIPIARAYAYMSVTASHLERYREAAEAHENVMRTLEKSPGSLDQDLVLIYSSAGEDLYDKGNHETAVQIFRQGLDVMEAMLGSDHPDLAAGHDAVGLTLYSKGEYRLALEEYKRSLQIKKATLEEDSPEVVEMTQLIEGVTTQWLEHRRDSATHTRGGRLASTLQQTLGHLGEDLEDYNEDDF